MSLRFYIITLPSLIADVSWSYGSKNGLIRDRIYLYSTTGYYYDDSYTNLNLDFI